MPSSTADVTRTLRKPPTPLPPAFSQTSPVVLDQLVVSHTVTMMCKVGVRSLSPKFTPLNVRLAPPVVGPFIMSVCVMTGAANTQHNQENHATKTKHKPRHTELGDAQSYVNNPVAVPTRTADVTRTLRNPPTPLPPALSHTSPVVLDHLDVSHTVIMTCAVGVKSFSPKFTPLNVMLALPLEGAFVIPACVTDGAAQKRK